MNHFFAGLRQLFAVVWMSLILHWPTTGFAESNSTSTPVGPGAPTATALMTPARQRELFDALDLDTEPLKPVRDAVEKGDYVAAEHAWANYLRQRTTVPWDFDYRHPKRNPAYKNQVADDAANGKVVGGGVSVYYAWPDNNIDWLYNATKASPPLDNEWQWQLCRMSFWGAMGFAYRFTEDECYARAWTKQLCSFVGQCPVPDHAANQAESAWRTLEAGSRMEGSWPDAFFSFLESPSVTDDDLALYTVSCLEHGRYLRQYHTTANWLTMEMNGLYTVGCLFPEFKEAADWRTFAVNETYQQEVVQLLPDGAQFELSTGYHNVTLNAIADLDHKAKLMGRVNDLPSDFSARLEKAFAYDLFQMTPDRAMPKFNDSWHVGVPGQMKLALDFFPDDVNFQWAATDGKEGHPPDSTSHYFPWSGYVAMRSGWDTKANYGAFRLGPIGYGHCHQDKLDFLIWSYGTEVLYSSGGGNYEQSKWRSYGVDTFSHNCVLVDGMPQRRQTKNRDANIAKEPINARWQTTPTYDFASGIYSDGYNHENDRIATQTRRILFIKPDLFLVADTLVPHDQTSHTYQARWQLRPPQTRQDPVTNEVTTTAPGQPNLAVVPLCTGGLEVKAVSAQTEPELLGWDIGRSRPSNIPATTVTHTKKGVDTQSFLTLFIPIKPGDPEPVKSVTTKDETSATVVLTDGRTLAISADPNPSGNLEVTETLADGTMGRHVKSE
jgi:hypothetical protein